MMGQGETIRLLQECDAGVQMGIASIQEVLPYVKEEKFRQLLLGCRDKHENAGGDSGRNWKLTGMRGKNRT